MLMHVCVLSFKPYMQHSGTIDNKTCFETFYCEKKPLNLYNRNLGSSIKQASKLLQAMATEKEATCQSVQMD